MTELGRDLSEWVVSVRPFVADNSRLVASVGQEMPRSDRRVELCPEAIVRLGMPREEWPLPTRGAY